MTQIVIVLQTTAGETKIFIIKEFAGTVCSVIHLFVFRIGNLVQTKFLNYYRTFVMRLVYICGQFGIAIASIATAGQAGGMAEHKANAKLVSEVMKLPKI